MSEPTVICPNCHFEIKLTESLAAPLIEATRRQFEQAAAVKELDLATREETIRRQQSKIAQERASIDEQVATKLATERVQMAEQEAKKAKLLAAVELNDKDKELADLQAVLKVRDEKLAVAQKAQADIIRKHRELDDAKREMDLNIENKVQMSLAQVRAKAKQEAEDNLRLKVTEKEEQIAAMQRQIEELRRRAEQGSQQLQGEALEIELETVLRAKFPTDIVEPVPKGEFGGDVIHRVIGAGGQACGSILWETKRTKNWSDSWLAKLRNDQRAAKADLALIVTNALPKGITAFDIVDGVWVTEMRCAVPVAIALRQSLIELNGARQAAEGQETKAQLVYQYLTGSRFRHRVEAIVENFTAMQSDLERERRAMTRLWAKREEQIRGVIESTVGMYGDLQGIAGKALDEIEGLSVPLIESSPLDGDL